MSTWRQRWSSVAVVRPCIGDLPSEPDRLIPVNRVACHSGMAVGPAEAGGTACLPWQGRKPCQGGRAGEDDPPRTPLNRSSSIVGVGLLVALRCLMPAPPLLAVDAESPPGCPEWAKERVPDWVKPFLGRFGLPDPYPQQKEPLGAVTAGVDLWQANHFVVYRKETADYLYRDYTPLKVDYKKGSLPRIERIAAKHTRGCKTDREKALALLTRAMPAEILHPSIPPLGPDCPPNRAMSDEDLLKSHTGWCNEQARVYVRLCQVTGIPARMIFLFYSDRKSGHVIAEFYADGRWSMADASWCCVFPAPDGHLMSAAECHTDGPNKLAAGEAYLKRGQEVAAYPDKRLAGKRFAHIKDRKERGKKIAEAAEQVRAAQRSQTAQKLGDQLWAFGVMNYPLPK